jgi:transposase
MSNIFHKYEPDQVLLFPPSPRDWLPEDHLVWFISDAVDELDIGPLLARYRPSGKGNLAYHPRMMLKLLIYGYATGVFSSRKIARQIEENVAFRVLAAGHRPNHRTICRFRERHLEDFEDQFVQVVQIATAAGLAKLGTIALDGSKVKANASKHKAMSYERMQEEERRLAREIRELTRKRLKTSATVRISGVTSFPRRSSGGNRGWRRSGRPGGNSRRGRGPRRSGPVSRRGRTRGRRGRRRLRSHEDGLGSTLPASHTRRTSRTSRIPTAGS